MADLSKDAVEPWSPYISAMVMAGLAVLSGIEGGVAVAFGGEDVARISFGTAYACAIAALGGLVYALWRARSKSA